MKTDKYLKTDFSDNSGEIQFSRREFLKITAGGIFIFFMIGDSELMALQRMRPALPTDFNTFLRIGEDGRVSCFTGKIEMGQGVLTSLAQELADELDVDLESVNMIMGDTDLCPWDMGTFGSRTTRFFGPPLRAAGAEGRQVLIELAAEALKQPIENLVTENGVVFDKTNKKNQISYAQLAKGQKIERHLTGTVAVKQPAEFRIMGKSVLRRDAREKVTGQAKYAGDIQLPGMVYAKILRPPAHGAKLVDVDLSGAKQVAGVQIIKEGDFIAVLHQYPDVAENALSKIKVKFEKPESNIDDKNIFDHLLNVASPGEVVASGGSLLEGEKAATAVFEETYLNDYVAHAPMEPHTAMVKIEGNKATVWPSSQTPFSAKEEVARELGFPPENVRVISPFVGGGFGGKSRNLQVVEAARCARLSGKPVQVAWSRKEEFFYDSFRPAAIVKIRSGTNAAGSISIWDYHQYFAGERGSQHFYTIRNHSTVAHGSGWEGPAGSHPFATGPWRAPANNTNTFARESQIDIMAVRVGKDPVESRLQNLVEDKMKRVLKAAAEKFGWQPAKSPSSRGWGVACGIDAGED